MSKRNRILLGSLAVFATVIAYLLHGIIADLEPRYREAAEEPLVDMARVLAAVVARDYSTGDFDSRPLGAAFAGIYQARFSARIHDLEKSTVDVHVYVTDAAGTVLFDSLGRDVGKDYSRWNDVHRTLRGDYGARTSHDPERFPDSLVMYVAAPVIADARVVGVLSVGKPTRNLNDFAERARRKIIAAGVGAIAALVSVGLLVAIWLTRPFGLISDYIRLIRAGRESRTPSLRRSAIGVLGAAYDEMRDALAGRNYVEEYVQALTHEIKSPLSAIQGAAELLREDMPAAQRARFLDNIRVGTRAFAI